MGTLQQNQQPSAGQSTGRVVNGRVKDQLLLLFALTLRGPSGGHCVELLFFPSSRIYSFRDDPPGALPGPLRGASG